MDGYTRTEEWTGSWNPALDFNQNGNFVEIAILLSDVGSPTSANVHLNMINEQGGVEASYACVPSNSHANQHDPDYGWYYAFDLSGSGVPTSYSPQQ